MKDVMDLESYEYTHTEAQLIERQPTAEQLEISVTSEKDLDRLRDWLETIIGSEGAEQCVFVLKTMIDEDFRNHCKDATQEFGKRLATRFGEEESFFDLVPDAEFSDVRSYEPLSKVGYRGDYHSVAMLELSQEEKRVAVLVDLTYSNVASGIEDGTALVLYVPGSADDAMTTLQKKYGGVWKVDLKLNTTTGTFVFTQ